MILTVFFKTGNENGKNIQKNIHVSRSQLSDGALDDIKYSQFFKEKISWIPGYSGVKKWADQLDVGD